jgi:hypothetical protein
MPALKPGGCAQMTAKERIRSRSGARLHPSGWAVVGLGWRVEALERGHEWVVPCDADEIWHGVDPEQPITDWLAALPQEVTIVKADVFDHVPTADDPREENPVERIGFRCIRPNKKKVACRLTECPAEDDSLIYDPAPQQRPA